MLTGISSSAPCINLKKKMFIFACCLTSTYSYVFVKQCHFTASPKRTNLRGAGVRRADGTTSYDSATTGRTGYILCMYVSPRKKCLIKCIPCAENVTTVEKIISRKLIHPMPRTASGVCVCVSNGIFSLWTRTYY